MTSRNSSRRACAPYLFTAVASLALVACGGGSSSTAGPDAPTMLSAAAGAASALIAFTAPAYDGGAAIANYTATCSAGTNSYTGSATASPVSVTGLTNGTAYVCTVAASNAVGSGAASASVSVTPVAVTTGSATTAGVQCSYSYNAFNSSASVNAISSAAWSCDSSSRKLSANGIPDHAVGTFPNPDNPNTISAQTVAATFSLSPAYSGTATQLGGPAGAVSFMLNGIKTDPGTGGSCDNTGTVCSGGDNSGAWSLEALTQSYFKFGTDSNNAHVQPGGTYHYHGMPEGLITKLGGSNATMTLIGWAADGFPVYARYGHTVAGDASSPLKAMTGSWQKVSTVSANRPATSLYALGTFLQDWQYVAGSGDLDECNGRTGVTPEFPQGIYHYYATDTYPFLQRCVKGAVASSGAPSGPPPGALPPG